MTNNASATGTPAGGILTDPTDAATATAIQTPSLSIDKSTTTATYDSVGDTLTYSYLVTNTGNVTLERSVHGQRQPLDRRELPGHGQPRPG